MSRYLSTHDNRIDEEVRGKVTRDRSSLLSEVYVLADYFPIPPWTFVKSARLPVFLLRFHHRWHRVKTPERWTVSHALPMPLVQADIALNWCTSFSLTLFVPSPLAFSHQSRATKSTSSRFQLPQLHTPPPSPGRPTRSANSLLSFGAVVHCLIVLQT